MNALPRLRVHPALGTAVLTGQPGDGWVWILNGRAQQHPMTDEWVHRDGWAELTVGQPAPPLLTQAALVGPGGELVTERVPVVGRRARIPVQPPESGYAVEATHIAVWLAGHESPELLSIPGGTQRWASPGFYDWTSGLPE